MLHGRSIPGRDADDHGRDFGPKDVGGLHALGGHLDLEVPVSPPYRQGQGIFPGLPDFRRKMLPAAHRLTSHRQDLVAFLQARLGRGGTLFHPADFGGEIGNAGKSKDQKEGQRGENQIEGGPRQDNQKPMPERVMGK